jgi:hypothetical protein
MCQFKCLSYTQALIGSSLLALTGSCEAEFQLSAYFDYLLLLPFVLGPLGLFPITINMELWILLIVGRTPWTSDQHVSWPLPTQVNTDTSEMITDIHVSSGIRTHDTSV